VRINSEPECDQPAYDAAAFPDGSAAMMGLIKVGLIKNSEQRLSKPPRKGRRM
jgi:hypothetical protein